MEIHISSHIYNGLRTQPLGIVSCRPRPTTTRELLAYAVSALTIHLLRDKFYMNGTSRLP